MSMVLKILVGIYKMFLSPALSILVPTGCRHYPTCSQYCYCAIKRYGVARGLLFGARRVLLCNPWVK